jgi:hypothetical protein
MPSAGEIAKSVMCGNGWFCAECLLADLALPGVELHDFFHDTLPLWTKNTILWLANCYIAQFRP